MLFKIYNRIFCIKFKIVLTFVCWNSYLKLITEPDQIWHWKNSRTEYRTLLFSNIFSRLFYPVDCLFCIQFGRKTLNFLFCRITFWIENVHICSGVFYGKFKKKKKDKYLHVWVRPGRSNFQFVLIVGKKKKVEK